MSILGDEALSVELLTGYVSVFILLNHGEAREVAPSAHEAVFLPFPCIDSLKASHVGCGIDKELLAFRVVGTKEARHREDSPLFRHRRPSSGIFAVVILAHLYRHEAIGAQLIALLSDVVVILSDILRHVARDALHHICHSHDTAVDGLKAGACDVTPPVIRIRLSVLRSIHVMPESAQDVVDKELSRFSVVQVEYELARMRVLVHCDDLLDTSLASRVPSRARQYLDRVVFDGWYGEAFREFQVPCDDGSIRQDFRARARTYTYLYILLVVADGHGAFQYRFALHQDGVVESDVARRRIIVCA